MNNLKSKIYTLFGTGIIYLIGEFLRGSWFVNTPLGIFCQPYLEDGIRYCNSPYLDTGLVLIIAAQMLATVAVIVLFANGTGFKRWWHFSKWYVPIAAAIDFVFFPRPFLMITIQRDAIMNDLGALYIAITLGIVLWSWVFRKSAAQSQDR